ncbi:hypothetical protein C8J56DRAFT_813965 [Mycena floridula]|nr:hypothetical protein C8J56DRAFT_813965 [Mycena floridula]
MEALANILSELADKPYDFSLHLKNVQAASQLQDDGAELQAAQEMMSNFYAVGDEIWLPLIEAKKVTVDLNTVNGIGELLGLYERAENDYLSIPILKSHLELVVERYLVYAGGEEKPAEFAEIFGVDWTLSTIETIVSKATGHLTQSHLLWDQQRDWELERLESASGSDKAEIVEHVRELFLTRLAQPHSNSDETFQAYSSFTTNYQPPDQYETMLVAASKIRAKGAKAYERRERSENAIAESNSSLDSLARYATYERKSKTPDISVMSTVYERAIAEAAKRKFNGEAGSEEALRSFWTGYCDALRLTDAGDDIELEVLKRAVRSVPGSGQVWARYIRHIERFVELDQERIANTFNQAFATNLVQTDVEEIIPVILARASYERRRIEAGDADEDTLATLIAILESGIEMVRKASATGDPRLRLEKYLTEIYRSAGLEDNTIQALQEAAKHYKTSYFAWTTYADAVVRKENYTKARAIYKDVSSRNTDWPEAIWEAWLTFEHLHGSVAEVDKCLDQIEQLQFKVNAQRAKEAQKAAYQAMQMVVDEVPASASAGDPVSVADEEMDVDVPQASQRGTKRSADDSETLDAHKKARTEPPSAPLKRDRENCTVFVASLPTEVTEEDLMKLFKDCGEIREVKITRLSTDIVATVEFVERDSVPAGLTKDKKRVRDQEIMVHLAWQSTLYITNFPETADDAFIRDLFTKYGTIFDVRWPSKKFKSTRRFCYLQFTSPGSAQSALELHGNELQPNLPLNVFISNPERRKERTDQDSNVREVYVGGLSRFTTQIDLEKLFKTYGAVKNVRMTLDKEGLSKGFAFIEFEEASQAQAALQANNHELKGRRIAVTLSDSRGRSKPSGPNPETGLGPVADIKSRSVRLRGLPAGTQEGLLQQTLEKISSIKRLEVFEELNEAVVELESIAEAGKLLLRTEPLIFSGATLQVSEDGKTDVAAAGPTAGFVPRAAKSRPRAGLGSKKKPVAIPPPTADPRTDASSSKPSVPAKSKGQDDFRKMLGGT